MKIFAAGEFDGRRPCLQVPHKEFILAGGAFIGGQQ
jgi:hypothetical protein